MGQTERGAGEKSAGKGTTEKKEPDIGDVFKFPFYPWNSTILAVNETKITMHHYPIPDTIVNTENGPVHVRFTKTSIILYRNSHLAGKTLLFDVEIISINKGYH
jgi:hypothetical protein